ncbi:MAG: hypothetical protein A2751_01605 [Candidatus Doudnabacteria bacterium RIFCSPHIGHO2_01_FULL_46_14]|uniref:Uncharacterized protein n=1 Tax=Candidatus Doudnabacteria bacterium RIFCSPHIGHO2_01_FULL_46_14 TaxID=1817824 RepID=A0A1F5NJB3_9BACT|nr:MAG: hypothetical protein A2751_01605 [Candidatus Doudnabacteria bacterium RIFCSPHIGHO2_01_FULL_46_14]
MVDVTKLWDKRYLFGPNPFDLARSDHIFFVLAITCVIIAAAAKIIVLRAERGSPKKILFGRVFHLFLTIGILLGIWYGARIERIPWIYTHFTALLLLIVGLVWFGFITRFYLRVHRSAQERWQDEQVKLQYLKR